MLNEKKINWVILNRILVPIFILYFLFIVSSTLPNFYPMFTDSGTYAYVGQQINKGKLLYRDVFEIKLPGIYYIYATIFKIFPDSRWTLYFVDLLITISIFFFIYQIFKKFGENKYFWIFSIFFLSSYRVYPSYCDGNLNEHWYIFFYLLFYYLIFTSQNKFKYFLAGFSFSFLFFLKQNFWILNLILLYLYFRKIKNLYFFLGFIPLTSFFIFIILKSYPESLKAILFFPLQRQGEEKILFSARLKDGITYGPLIQFLFLFILGLLKRNELWKAIFFQGIAILFITFFLPLFYFHYLLLLVIILVPTAIVILKNYPVKFFILLLIFLTILPVKFIKIRIKHSLKALKLTLIENDLRIASPPMTFTIIFHLKENEKFIMIPTYPEIYFLTKTESPYRFFIFDDVVSRFYKGEFKRMIRKKPPDYIYLEKDISYFENIFDLSKDEYIINQIDLNFYKFKLK
jgi:hypothetical protein